MTTDGNKTRPSLPDERDRVVSDLAVDVQHLSVRFADFYAVRDVSFQVRRGEIFGFLGANGAGKTTTIRVLCGLLAPSEGTIQVLGQDLHHLGKDLKSHVGYMSQKFTLYQDMSVLENLEFAAELHRLPAAQAKKRRQELLDFIGWQRNLDILVKDLPGGQKQQVSLIAAMMHDPDLIFLDEPTAGVSPAARSRFWQLIRGLAEKGKTVFVTTHYMDEAEQCERIALMRSGELVALDSPQDLKRHYFPQGLWSLEHLSESQIRDIRKLLNEGTLSMFEPHGLSHHFEMSCAGPLPEALQNLQPEKIKPSLEDVFIRVVEGKNR